MAKEQEIARTIVNDSTLNPRAAPFLPCRAVRDQAATACLAFLNVCSLRRKVREIQTLLTDRGIQLFGMAETWLNPEVSDGELAIPNYRLYRKDRLGQHGGGVAVYCHESLSVRRRHDLDTDLEIIWLETTGHGATMLVGCAYRPPDKPVAYWDSLEEHLDHALSGCHESVVLLGDFNVDFSGGLAPPAQRFHSILTKFNLLNHVTSATRVTSSSAKILDLFLTTAPTASTCETVPIDVSDHFAVLADMPFPGHRKRPKQNLKSTRRMHRVNWQQFCSAADAHARG